ncbi:MAG: gliding motility protein GldN [Muribaculaceae bacterium]
MNALKIFATALLIAISASASAQTESTASVVRRAKADAQKDNARKAGNVTERMQKFYETKTQSDADLQWMRVIYRNLDIKQDANTCLFYPEEPNQDGQSLFFIVMRLLINNQINAYEYLDGREMFTDQYKVKLKDMLDRYGIIYTNAKGSTEKNPKFAIEDADIPGNEVLSYYIVERYEFDRVSNTTSRHVEAICPVLHRASDWGGEAVRYPMFWVKLADLRPYLAQQYVFTDNDNNLPRYNYDDYFARNMYRGEIYKTKNLRNQTLVQLFPDPDDLKHAQDSIEARLASFDKNLWVPTREELQARAEAAEANDSTAVIKNRDDGKSVKRSATNKRAQSKTSSTKQTKVKTQKTKSSATRSVRARK